MLRIHLFSLAALIAAGTACKPGAAGTPAPAPRPAAPVAEQRPPIPRTPDDWHSTDSIFKDMSGVAGKRIANLTLDDPHYAFRLVQAGASVLVITPDPATVKAVEKKRKEWKVPATQLSARLTPADSVGLSPGEVDAVLFTRTYSQVKQRQAFFTRLREATRGLHQVTLVDFLQLRTPMGPPMDQRMDPEEIMNELGRCGFEDILALSKQIPYRVVIIAQDFTGMPGE